MAKYSSISFNITDLACILAFAAAILLDNPDLDCVILNSGYTVLLTSADTRLWTYQRSVRS